MEGDQVEEGGRVSSCCRLDLSVLRKDPLVDLVALIKRLVQEHDAELGALKRSFQQGRI